MNKKRIWFCFLLVFTICLSCSSMCSAGWKYSKAKKAYRYYNTRTKTYAKAGWKKIGKKWYYFDAHGYAKFGRFTASNGKVYYCKKRTGRVTKKRIGDYYYGSDGAMVKNTWAGGYYYGSNGKALYGKICINGKYYYVYKKSGKVKNRWIHKQFYNKNGVLVNNSWIKGSTISTTKLSGGTYVDETGKITQGNKNPKDPPSQSDINLLSALIYCEAGNQSYWGKVAVGSVVINRIQNRKFPNTLRGVIYQSGQFTPAGTGWLSRVLYGRDRGYRGSVKTSCTKAATEVLTDGSKLKGYFYFNTSHGRKKIGAHYFS